jgi:hypothetical protein
VSMGNLPSSVNRFIGQKQGAQGGRDVNNRVRHYERPGCRAQAFVLSTKVTAARNCPDKPEQTEECDASGLVQWAVMLRDPEARGGQNVVRGTPAVPFPLVFQ